MLILSYKFLGIYYFALSFSIAYLFKLVFFSIGVSNVSKK